MLTGRFYFLEIAARVGGAFIADLVQVSTGVNLWREWARLEIAALRGQPYVLPGVTQHYAGSVLCLSHTAEPDTSGFDAPEIVYRMKKHHHAGLIVRSEEPERVEQLLESYSDQFARMFLATMPARRKAHGLTGLSHVKPGLKPAAGHPKKCAADLK